MSPTPNPSGQPPVGHDQVSTFAVLADNPHRFGSGRIGAARQKRLVTAAVEDRTVVVAHATVNATRRCGCPASSLTVPIEYKVRAAAATMDRPGSAVIRVCGLIRPEHRRARWPRPIRSGSGADLAVQVRDPETSANDEFGQIERSKKRAQYLGCLLERRNFEDLAPDVGMDADEFDPRHELQSSHGFFRRT